MRVDWPCQYLTILSRVSSPLPGAAFGSAPSEVRQMYAGTRPRNLVTALSYEVRSSRKTEMPMAASVMLSSQFPLLFEPLMTLGR